ncbi:uncharacterized protein SAPINGB_P001789 [Magnusiomyces paraingens]|uniref:Pseudouridine synthase RsuA/RluA-like domain-containing protein n=1 Tax=Magnusiomyces paraingens TaxID=2606893 RepID=A0A5E8BB85_9ASCO|nr:uncharacterized protein SAPINGB_P001789 [Saprochaete ingens]VVT48458.1 unnamed protein product [Saprochaete ingens]
MPPRISILKQLPHYLVINKPPACYSQPPDTSPANKQLELHGISPNDTVLAHLRHDNRALFDESKLTPPFCPPKLVHRLDYPVSGAMVLATSTQAAAHFAKNLKHGGSKGWVLQKYYAALVLGSPKTSSSFLQKTITWTPDIITPEGTTIKTGIIAKYIDGKSAFTRFWIPPQPKTSPSLPYSLVLFSPLTGRKHQIRKHAAEVLHTPILGDSIYIESIDRKKSKLDSITKNTPLTPLADLSALYPVNGIALHSYMVHLETGLAKSSIQAPFFRNTEAWDPFLTKDRLLPDSIYTSCVAEKIKLT